MLYAAHNAPMEAPTHRLPAPRRVLGHHLGWPLWSTLATRACEEQWRARLGEGALMRAAGRSVARLTRALAPHAQRVWVAAGPGGNGGDGLHAASELRTAGVDVEVTLTTAAYPPGSEAALALVRAQEAGVRISHALPAGAFQLAIDALLGMGANRPPQGALLAALHALQASQAPVLAVDVPSGLAAETGIRIGADALRADATLALLTLKPGLLTGGGREHVGELWFDDLGYPPDAAWPALARVTSQEEVSPVFRRGGHDRHKGSFGDVLVVGGAPGMVGAARLAGLGALAAGPGRVFLSLLDEHAAASDPAAPEWLMRPHAWLPGRHPLEASTVVCGCGGGNAVAHALPTLLSRAGQLVLDADALNAVAQDAALRRLLQARTRAGRPCVLTPHPLEAARLLGWDTARVQADRLAAAQALVRDLGAITILKGSGTVLASPLEVPRINPTGSASLSGGGTGDVLAGWIAGLWSRHHPASASSAAAPLAWRAGWQASLAATWSHGRAGERPREAPLRASTLAQMLSAFEGP